MEKRWVLQKQSEPEKVKTISQALNIAPSLANLLVQRGVNSFEEAKDFFRPSLDNLHNPFLMKDMDKAVERLGKAILNNEKILVYGDYDVDGTTAVALMYTFLKTLSDSIEFYIPDRYDEGYGISYKGIDYAIKAGVTLIVVLDCGIKAIEKVAYAKENNVDFIICDHHRPDETLPPAAAILDPKRPDCEYPFKELSGCGVGFKLMQAYMEKHHIDPEQLIEYLDLVVVSIASDIVPIVDENRILAYHGLRRIHDVPRPGLKAIMALAGLWREDRTPSVEKPLTISDLVFSIGPRINAAGRMESGRNSVDLLICTEKEDAKQKANVINDHNTDRRNLDSLTTTQALEKITNDPTFVTKKSTVLYNPEWHKGVIGIVASRLTEVYYRPTIIFCQSNGLITGSARSVKDFDIYDAIDQCRDLLEHFGGHKYAAGLSIKPEKLAAFQEKFEQIVSSTIEDRMLVPEVAIDSTINLTDITPKFFRILKQFAPFGPGNLAPIFLTKDLYDSGFSRIVGKNHIKLSVVHKHISCFPMSGIAFQLGDKFEIIQSNRPFNICYHIEENIWNGRTSLQLNVKDMKPSEEEVPYQ